MKKVTTSLLVIIAQSKCGNNNDARLNKATLINGELKKRQEKDLHTLKQVLNGGKEKSLDIGPGISIFIFVYLFFPGKLYFH